MGFKTNRAKQVRTIGGTGRAGPLDKGFRSEKRARHRGKAPAPESSYLASTQREVNRALIPLLTTLKRDDGTKREVGVLTPLLDVASADAESLRAAQALLEELAKGTEDITTDSERGGAGTEGFAPEAGLVRAVPWSAREIAPRSPDEVATYARMLIRLIKLVLLLALVVKSPAMVETVIEATEPYLGDSPNHQADPTSS